MTNFLLDQLMVL